MTVVCPVVSDKDLLMELSNTECFTGTVDIFGCLSPVLFPEI